MPPHAAMLKALKCCCLEGREACFYRLKLCPESTGENSAFYLTCDDAETLWALAGDDDPIILLPPGHITCTFLPPKASADQVTVLPGFAILTAIGTEFQSCEQCENNKGVCCRPNGTCIETSKALCDGNWYGKTWVEYIDGEPFERDLTCADVNCADPPSSCCICDVDPTTDNPATAALDQTCTTACVTFLPSNVPIFYCNDPDVGGAPPGPDMPPVPPCVGTDFDFYNEVMVAGDGNTVEAASCHCGAIQLGCGCCPGGENTGNVSTSDPSFLCTVFNDTDGPCPSFVPD